MKSVNDDDEMPNCHQAWLAPVSCNLSNISLLSVILSSSQIIATILIFVKLFVIIVIIIVAAAKIYKQNKYTTLQWFFHGLMRVACVHCLFLCAPLHEWLLLPLLVLVITVFVVPQLLPSNKGIVFKFNVLIIDFIIHWTLYGLVISSGWATKQSGSPWHHKDIWTRSILYLDNSFK